MDLAYHAKALLNSSLIFFFFFSFFLFNAIMVTFHHNIG